MSGSMKALVYFLVKIFHKVFFTVLYNVEVRGLENIPLTGRAILAANHESYLDSMVLFYISPRKFHAVAGKWLFKVWWLSWVFRVTDCIPTNGSSAGVINALNRDELVLIFPEGICRRRRERIVARIHKGIAVFALTTGAPVIPIGIRGTFEAWPQMKFPPRLFMKICVTVGSPLRFEKYEGNQIPENVLEGPVQEIAGSIKKLL